MISRRNFVNGAVGLGLLVLGLGLLVPRYLAARNPRGNSVAQTIPIQFDYYIAPNGDDSNAGTLAAPWAITSLVTNSSNFTGVGSSNGTTGGSACDMGAWGGAATPTSIGCSFA